jgi:hypothetical protein
MNEKTDIFYLSRPDLSEDEKIAHFNSNILEAIDQADKGDVFSPEEVLNFLQHKISTRFKQTELKNAG